MIDMQLGERLWIKENGETTMNRLVRKIGLYDANDNPVTLYEFERFRDGQPVDRFIKFAEDV